ncbi:uncharacterized protein [Palaemon carinicauda]|uniref:uncharacterized protein n=1 Tax=Palaemon carinicauda TaxID=392227 RepID=UPI0035B59D6D
MSWPLKLLTMAVMSLEVSGDSSATHPFYQAFSPLREAFGETIFDLQPSSEVKALYTTQTADAIRDVDSDVIRGLEGDFIRDLDGDFIRDTVKTENPGNQDVDYLTSISAGTRLGPLIPEGGARLGPLIPEGGARQGPSILPDQQKLATGPVSIRQRFEVMEPEKSVFNLDTFTFNRNNTRRRDDIFSALADVETEEDENLRINSIPNNRNPSKSQDSEDHGTANDSSKKILHVVKSIENVLSTMSFMKGLYHSKKASLTSSSSTPPSTSHPTSNETSSASSILDVLLDVPMLEGLRTVGLTARTERDFLDHMASVLVGAEQRSSALTLDPVTVIALLTLAAYLLRAVYEIIAVKGERSLSGDLAFSDLPETLTKIHHWISSSSLDGTKFKRATRDVKDNLDVPGDLAAVLKLHRQGDHSCVKEFLCQQLQYRPLKSLKLSDMMTGWISYYYGDPTISKLIDSAQGNNDVTCANSNRQSCSLDTLVEISQLRSIFNSMTEKLLILADSNQN